MRIRLKAPQGLTTTGIYGADGKEAEVGTELTVKEEPFGWFGRYDIIGDDDGKEAVLNPAPGQPINKAADSTDGENPFPGAETASQDQMDGATATPSAPAAASGYAVKSKDGGWYVITKDGQDYSKNLRKNDVEGFDELSDAEKAEFAELHKAD